MTFQQSDTLARGGEWLMDAARRRPEALLLMAAGCALLMRPGGARGVDSVARRMSMSGQQRHQPGRGAGGSRSRMGEDVSRVGENLGAAAQTIRSGISRSNWAIISLSSNTKTPICGCARSSSTTSSCRR